MNFRPVPCWLTLIILPLLLVSCAGTSSHSREVYYYTLNYAPPTLLAEQSLPIVLRVDRFSSAPPFNSQSIIYADQGLYRNAYTRHRWIAPPAEVLTFLLVRDLQNVKALQAVLPPDSFIGPTHIVNGWLEEILEEDRPDDWQASLRLSITLLAAREPDPSRRILYQKTYAASEPVAERTPASLAEALSRAAGRLSSEMVGDIYQKLRTSNF